LSHKRTRHTLRHDVTKKRLFASRPATKFGFSTFV